MDHATSVALMKFLSRVAVKLGIGHTSYVVGGAVRNFLMGIPAKDVDIVVDPIRIGRKDASDWFAKELAKVIPAETDITTNQYGVAILTVKGDWALDGHAMRGEVVEIANARKESYGGGEGKGYKPHMVEPATIEEDALRREFRVNAIMWKMVDLVDGPENAPVVDPTGKGLEDLKNRVLECPVDPDKVFTDDASRMIRSIKFLLKYGLKSSQCVKDSIKRNAQKLKNIPPSHLSNMLINDFYETGLGKRALLEMDKLGLLEVIKEIVQENKAFRNALGNWAEKADIKLMFDLMDLGMPVGRGLTFLSKPEQDRVREITANMDAAEGRKFVALLEQPGQAIDTPALMAEFSLSGPQVRQITLAARSLLLENPGLAQAPQKWEGLVRDKLSGASMVSKVASRWLTAASGDIWYHGSPKDFDTFETQFAHTFGTGASETPLFFTQEEYFAKMYARGKGFIYKVRLDPGKVFDGADLYQRSQYWPPEKEDMTQIGKELYEDLENNRIFKGLIGPDFEGSHEAFGDSQGTLASILKNEYDVMESSEMKKWLRSKGFDSFYVKGDGEKNLALFSPKSIEILEKKEAYPGSGKTGTASDFYFHPYLKGRDYWDTNLENRVKGPDLTKVRPVSSAIAFLGHKLEAAGDLWREVTGETGFTRIGEYSYLNEKLRRLRAERHAREWEEALTPQEQADVDIRRGLIEEIPARTSFHLAFKRVLRAVVNRDPRGLADALDVVADEISKLEMVGRVASRYLQAEALPRKGKRYGFFIFGKESDWELSSDYSYGAVSAGKWTATPSLYSENEWRNLAVDGATEYSAGFRKALKEIVAEYPEFSEWVIKFDGPWVKVSDLMGLSGGSSVDWKSLTLYHGTSRAAWESIQKQGLLPRNLSGMGPSYGTLSQAGEGRKDAVYLTSQLDMAKFAARDAGRVTKSVPVILAIKGLDPQYLRGDEDSGVADAVQSLERLGSVAYIGLIPAKNVSLFMELGGDSNQWVKTAGWHSYPRNLITAWRDFAKQNRRNHWALPYSPTFSSRTIEEELQRRYVQTYMGLPDTYSEEQKTTQADAQMLSFVTKNESLLKRMGEANQRRLDSAGDREALVERVQNGTATAADILALGKDWSGAKARSPETKRAKERIVQRIVELAKRHHWTAGYRLDPQASKYKYVLQVDSPHGSVAFHEAQPSVDQEYAGKKRVYNPWASVAEIVDKYGMQDGGVAVSTASRVASRFLSESMDFHQDLLHVTGSPSTTACPEKPDKVWTIIHDKHPKLPFTPVHKVNAFLEDQIHDWKWEKGSLRYFSRVINENQPVWLLLEFGQEGPKKCPKCNKDFPAGSNFCPDCGVKLVAKVASRFLSGSDEDSNLKGMVEVPRNTFPVKVEPPQKKRKKFPFEGYIDFQGLEIDVENKEGSVRKGVGPDGTPWETKMLSNYGEIRGTEGVDSDLLDAYVGPNHDSSLVVVIHQHEPDTGKYDEDKVMLGFDSTEEAIGAYKKQYNKPGFFVEDEYTAMPIGQFWRWVHDDRNHGKRVQAKRVAARWLSEE